MKSQPMSSRSTTTIPWLLLLEITANWIQLWKIVTTTPPPRSHSMSYLQVSGGLAADLLRWSVGAVAEDWGEEMPRSLTGCNLTDENAELQRKGSGCMHAMPNNNRRMRFYCLTKSQEGGTEQRKTVLKLCRGDRSNLAVKCLLVGIVERWCRMRRGERSEWSFFWSIRDFIDMASCW